MVIVIVLLVIALAGAVYFCYEGIEESIKLQNRYDNLRRDYEKLQERYRVMKKRKNVSYWLSLLRNPDRDKIEIASTEVHNEIEVLGIGPDSPGYSVYVSARMYGDGRIDGRFINTSKSRGVNRSFHGEPQTKKDVTYFFGNGDYADWLWDYYEFYRDFVKGREHTLNK